MNFQESTTISNTHTKNSGNLSYAPRIYIYIHIYIYIWEISFTNIKISSSSLSCRATSTDNPDPLLPLLPIVHSFWHVNRATSGILTELLYVMISKYISLSIKIFCFKTLLKGNNEQKKRQMNTSSYLFLDLVHNKSLLHFFLLRIYLSLSLSLSVVWFFV